MKNDTDMVVAVESVARDGLGEIENYFSQSGDEADGSRADRALKLVGAYSRIRATRANEAAITVAVAKFMGIKGEALAPLWEQLTGTKATNFLPTPSESSSGEPESES